MRRVSRKWNILLVLWTEIETFRIIPWNIASKIYVIFLLDFRFGKVSPHLKKGGKGGGGLTVTGNVKKKKRNMYTNKASLNSDNKLFKVGGIGVKACGKMVVNFQGTKKTHLWPPKIGSARGKSIQQIYAPPPTPFKKVNKQTMWWEARSTIRFKQTANK